VAHFIEQSADSAMVDPDFFHAAVQSLMQASQRSDGGEANLRTSAFQALASIVSVAPIPSLQLVDEMVVFLTSQLESLSAMDILNADDRIRQQELQGHYAAVLQSAIKVLEGEQVCKHADRLMAVLQHQLSSIITQASSRPPTPMEPPSDDSRADAQSSFSAAPVWEDSLMLLGCLIAAIGEYSSKYIDSIGSILAASLSGSYHQETSLIVISIIDIGEFAQALKDKFTPIAPLFLQLLASLLSSSIIQQSVKPKAISAVGDIALSIGSGFARNQQSIQGIIPILLQAAQVVSLPPTDMDNWEQVDFIVDMRAALVETFTCIIQGSSDDRQAMQALNPSVPIILSFIQSIVSSISADDADILLPDSLIKSVIGLLGDTACSYGSTPGPINVALKEPWVGALLSGQRRRRNLPDHIDQVLRWTSAQLAKL
jgi:importin subunit beta-1